MKVKESKERSSKNTVELYIYIYYYVFKFEFFVFKSIKLFSAFKKTVLENS